MNKIIFVNATAATEGGALTILEQFLDNIFLYSKSTYIYYIFCTSEKLNKYKSNNINIINNIKGKKWIDRIRWDLYGLKNWSKKKGIRADLIISFQNTGVRYYNDVRQLIYLHNPIPFSQITNWTFLHKNERILWFYKNIYKKIIRISLRKKSHIVVQTEWMKNAVVQQFNWNHMKISVIKPNLKDILIENIPMIDFNDTKFHILYPAPSTIYRKFKNYELIISALRYIKDNKRGIYNNLIIHFTIDRNLNNNMSVPIIKLIKDLNVSSNICFEGKLPYERILSFYKSCDLLVFPSYIETFGLPLIEAASFGLPILAADVNYAREVIGSYKGVKFLNYKDPKIWAENIIDLYNKRIKYKLYNINYKKSWKYFFELIEQLIYK